MFIEQQLADKKESLITSAAEERKIITYHRRGRVNSASETARHGSEVMQ